MTEASQVAQRVESASRPRAGGPRVGVSLVSVASAAPAAVISNAAVAARLGVDARWVETRTGVRERRIARDGETVVSLGVEAARGALERADLAADAVDLVLVATMTPDDITPNAAPLVAAGVGAQGAFVADVGAACTGFVSALALAGAHVEAGRSQNALVIGADLMSRVIDPDDRATAALFADGAGAVVLTGHSGASRIGPLVMGYDPAGAALVYARRDEGVLREWGAP